MAKVFVTYYVPTGYESQVPGAASARLVPYPGPADADPPTHRGGNTLLDDQSIVYSDLIGALATIPGSNHTVTPKNQWTNQVNWVGWLATNGLQVQVLAL